MKILSFYLLVNLVTVQAGLMFWPENIGRAHKVMYDGYMRGWNSIK